jgi:hypothetical protein
MTRKVWVATSTRRERAALAGRAFLFALRPLDGIFDGFPMSRNYHVAIAGATGAVGIEMMRVLERRNFPVGKLSLLASAKSAGKKLDFQGAPVEVRELTADAFDGVDFALFSAGGSISKEFAPAADRWRPRLGEGEARGKAGEISLLLPLLNTIPRGRSSSAKRLRPA